MVFLVWCVVFFGFKTWGWFEFALFKIFLALLFLSFSDVKFLLLIYHFYFFLCDVFIIFWAFQEARNLRVIWICLINMGFCNLYGHQGKYIYGVLAGLKREFCNSWFKICVIIFFTAIVNYSIWIAGLGHMFINIL